MSGGKGVWCTKPRQQLAKDGVKDLSKYYGHVEGIDIGYQVGGEGTRSIQKQAHIIFTTTQLLTNRILGNPEDLYNYRYVVVDEVHELTMEMIQVLYFIKHYIQQHA